MRKLVLSVIATMVSFSMFAQSSSEVVDHAMVGKIIDQGMSNKSQVMDYAWYLTDVVGPRLSGTEGLNRAYDWTMKTLTEMGLTNVRKDSWGGFGVNWKIESYGLEMLFPYYERMIVYPKAWSTSTNGFIEGEPILITINKESDFDTYRGKLNGKIVFTDDTRVIPLGKDPEAQVYTEEQLDEIMDMMAEAGPGRFEYPDFLKPYQTEIQDLMRQRGILNRKLTEFFLAEGVAARITQSRSPGKHGTVFTDNGLPYRLNAPKQLPELHVATEHYNKLVRLTKKGIKPVIRMEIKSVTETRDTLGYNILADLPGEGSLKDEIVMIGAHLDSWHAGTGATDNASGSVVMMEVMRILKTIDTKSKNRRTIRIALWGSEEQGLLGSRGYVNKYLWDSKDKKMKPEGEKFSAYFNYDNGTGKVRGIWSMGNAAAKPIFEAFLAPFEDYKANTVTLKSSGGSDHGAFDQVGLPGFGMMQDRVEYFARTWHTNMDVFDRLQERDLKQSATVIASLVYHVAIRKEKIPRK